MIRLPSSLLGTPWPAHFFRGSTADELDAICLLLRYYQNMSIMKFLISVFFLFIERISLVLYTFFFFFFWVPWLSSFFLLHIFLHCLAPLKLLSGESGDFLVHKSIMAPPPVSGVRQPHNLLSRADAAPGPGIGGWRVGCHLAAPCQSLRGRRHFSLLKSCTEPQRLIWSVGGYLQEKFRILKRADKKAFLFVSSVQFSFCFSRLLRHVEYIRFLH